MNRKHKIEFTVSCTEKEHEKAWFAVQFACGILRFWPLIFLFSLFLYTAAVYAVMIKGEPITNPLVVILCICAICIPIVYFIPCILRVNKRRRYYNRKYLSVGEKELTVFGHSVAVKSKLVSSDMPFRNCKRLIRRKDFYVLVQTRRTYLIIPKRQIPVGEEKELKERLKLCSAAYRLFHRG